MGAVPFAPQTLFRVCLILTGFTIRIRNRHNSSRRSHKKLRCRNLNKHLENGERRRFHGSEHAKAVGFGGSNFSDLQAFSSESITLPISSRRQPSVCECNDPIAPVSRNSLAGHAAMEQPA